MPMYSLQLSWAFAGLLAGCAVDASVQHDNLLLLQHHVEVLSKNGHAQQSLHMNEGKSIGLSSPLSEKGYQTVAALRSDDEMRLFIRRVAEKEARRIEDETQLNGLTPYYSGTTAVQNLENLKMELRRAHWVVDDEGRTAPLSEVGYQQVAKLKSKPHMVAYSRRILDASHKRCSDEGALHGLVPYFDGEISVQSFSQLQKELLSASWAVSREVEDPVETTVATTTLATTLATTTLATTLATTTLATTLATTTLATTLATTTLATTLATTTLATTLATTTPAPAEDAAELSQLHSGVSGHWNIFGWLHGSEKKSGNGSREASTVAKPASRLNKTASISEHAPEKNKKAPASKRAIEEKSIPK